MLAENSIALKEWAAVCLALIEGRQSLLVRKGGIAEGAGGFRFEHNEFWLFPTQFHQSAEQVADPARDLVRRVESQAPPPGRLHLSAYAEVRAVAFVEDESRLDELAGWHVMSSKVVRERFHYQRPGLFIAAVEVFQQSQIVDLADQVRYAGCHSWVQLERAISTSRLERKRPHHPMASAIQLVASLGGNPVVS
ncbi:MAG TPA: DUF1802 family protein [Caulifigura sp.]|nr:DUF1802 family protein [Caulifigura sp.]